MDVRSEVVISRKPQKKTMEICRRIQLWLRVAPSRRWLSKAIRSYICKQIYGIFISAISIHVRIMQELFKCLQSLDRSVQKLLIQDTYETILTKLLEE